MVAYRPAAWEWWIPFACWPGPCDCTQEAGIRWRTPLKEHCISRPRFCMHWSTMVGHEPAAGECRNPSSSWPEACWCAQDGHPCWQGTLLKDHYLRYPNGILAASTTCTACSSHWKSNNCTDKVAWKNHMATMEALIAMGEAYQKPCCMCKAWLHKPWALLLR